MKHTHIYTQFETVHFIATKINQCGKKKTNFGELFHVLPVVDELLKENAVIEHFLIGRRLAQLFDATVQRAIAKTFFRAARAVTSVMFVAAMLKRHRKRLEQSSASAHARSTRDNTRQHEKRHNNSLENWFAHKTTQYVAAIMNRLQAYAGRVWISNKRKHRRNNKTPSLAVGRFLLAEGHRKLHGCCHELSTNNSKANKTTPTQTRNIVCEMFVFRQRIGRGFHRCCLSTTSTSSSSSRFDVVVVGGGHAGTEAAAAAARCGARTALLTQRVDTIGVMSCNPSIGGIGKGHLVREIDAMDGLMARAVDEAGIQFRVLNRSKGPAVHGPRVQADRVRYRDAIMRQLRATPNLSIVEGSADAFLRNERGDVTGVVLADGTQLSSAATVLATGTFLGGRIHLGKESWPSGRMGDAPTSEISHALRNAGFELGRLKTGNFCSVFFFFRFRSNNRRNVWLRDIRRHTATFET